VISNWHVWPEPTTTDVVTIVERFEQYRRCVDGPVVANVQVPGPLSGTATSRSEALSVPATTAFVALAARIGPCAGTVVVVETTDALFAGDVTTLIVTGTVVDTGADVVVVADCRAVVVVVGCRVDVVVESRGRAPLGFEPRVKTRTSSRTGLDHISTCVALRGVRRDMVIEE
jgi:hypothetical protein